MDVLYMGSGYRPLEQILKNPHVNVKAVYVRPNPVKDNPRKSYPFVNYIEDLCHSKDIPLFQPKKLDEATIKSIADLGYDVLVSCGYHLLLPHEIINQARVAAINIHPGKLPEYRGQSVIEWAMINGEKSLHMTVHMLNEKFDEGEILMENEIPFLDSDNGNTMQGKLYTKAASMLEEFLKDPYKYLSNKQPQISGGNYYHRIKPENYRIDWSKDFDSINNLVRTLVYPRDGAYNELNGESVIIDKVIRGYDNFSHITPGQIVDVSDAAILVATKDSSCIIPFENIRNYFIVHDKIKKGEVLR